jgi:hypothetical protein
LRNALAAHRTNQTLHIRIARKALSEIGRSADTHRPNPGPGGTSKGTVIVAGGWRQGPGERSLLVNRKIRFPRRRRGSLITVCSDVRVLPAPPISGLADIARAHSVALLPGVSGMAKNEATGVRPRKLHQPRRDMLAAPSLRVEQCTHRLGEDVRDNRAVTGRFVAQPGLAHNLSMAWGNGERTTDRPRKPRERMRTNMHEHDEKRRFYLNFPVRPGRS